MKTRSLCLLLALAAAAPIHAQDYAYTAGALAPQQLDQLLSPIALYPDPLLGAILPASTHGAELAAAAGFVSANADPAQIDQQPWDDSVRVLAHYPTVTQWMAQNTEWTNQLGSAVAIEQPAVLDSIQRLRSNARAAGLLRDTPQQRVVVTGNAISIIPAQPDVVYVPTYDPQYIESPGSATTVAPITFGIGYHIGSWTTYGVDWRDRSVWFDHDRRPERDWNRIVVAPPRSREQWRPTQMTQSRRYSAPLRPAQISQPAPDSERSWRDSVGRTPTGRINSPAMEYNRTVAAPTDRRFHSEVQPAPQPAKRDEHSRRRDQEHHDKDHDDKDDRTPDR